MLFGKSPKSKSKVNALCKVNRRCKMSIECRGEGGVAEYGFCHISNRLCGSWQEHVMAYICVVVVKLNICARIPLQVPLLRSSSRVTAEEIGWRKAVVRRGREVVRRSCRREEPLVLTNNIEVIHNLAKLQNGLTRKYHPD